MNYVGVIIEESLSDKSILKEINIVSTKVIPTTLEHKTPWVKQWTMHTVSIPKENAIRIAQQISETIDTTHKSSWYVDYKSDTEHYIIYPNKVFHITDRSDKSQYDEATKYGISSGIPDYQVDFSPHIAQWDATN